MPGPVIPNPTPDWLKPENASVFDSPITKALRMIGHVIGADNPTSQVLGLMMTDVPGGSATGGLAKAVEGLKERALRAYHGSPNLFKDFSLEHAGTTTDPGKLGKALYFSTDPNVAKASKFQYEAAVTANNPLHLSMTTWGQDKSKMVTSALGLPVDASSEAITQAAKAKGFDSVMLDYSPLGYKHQEIAVFDPAQVSDVKGPNAIKAYHGSPHDFEQFSLSKIGTGEGAQAYGHGLYFAENEGVAKSYRDALSGSMKPTLRPSQSRSVTPWWDEAKTLFPDDPQRQDAYHWFNQMPNKKAALAYFDDVAKNGKYRYANADFTRSDVERLADEFYSGPGKMYEVAIHADPEDFLDWDKPLKDQPKKVRDRVLKQLKPNRQEQYMMSGGHWTPPPREDMTGREAYQHIADRLKEEGTAGQLGATLDLRGKGKAPAIPGIKYYDQGSRSAQEGTRNYVVFDDRLIDILKKYGLLLPAAGGAGQATISRRSE